MQTFIRKSLATIALCLLLAPLPGQAQWSEPTTDQVVVRGGWLFDGVSDTRRKNTGIVTRWAAVGREAPFTARCWPWSTRVCRTPSY